MITKVMQQIMETRPNVYFVEKLTTRQVVVQLQILTHERKLLKKNADVLFV